MDNRNINVINGQLDLVAIDDDGNERTITTVVGDAFPPFSGEIAHHFIAGVQLAKARKALAKAGFKTRFDTWNGRRVAEIDRLSYGAINEPVAGNERTIDESNIVVYVVPHATEE